jgi:hypothetical protein
MGRQTVLTPSCSNRMAREGVAMAISGIVRVEAGAQIFLKETEEQQAEHGSYELSG